MATPRPAVVVAQLTKEARAVALLLHHFDSFDARIAERVAVLFGPRVCHCGAAATCFGNCDGRDLAYSCDEHCRHECDDGRCVPVVYSST